MFTGAGIFLTCYRFRDNGGMVVGVTASVEKMMVQCSMDPVVKELDRARVHRSEDDCTAVLP